MIVFSGLPGTGKTRLAEAIGQGAAIPVFSVAWLLGALAPFGVLERSDRGAMAYELLTALVRHQLLLGQSAIVDGMVGSAEIRERWASLAGEHGARFLAVECVCSDRALQRERIEARKDPIPGWPDPGWDHVEAMRARYESWAGERLRVDAVEPYEQNLAAVERYLVAGGQPEGASPEPA